MSKKGYIYILESSMGFCKIGCSKDPHKRMQQFNVSLPFKTTLLHHIKVDDMYHVERLLHDFCKDERVGGEWFIIGHFKLAGLIDCETENDLMDELLGTKKWYTDKEFRELIKY